MHILPRIKYQEKLEKDENGMEKADVNQAYIIPHFKAVYMFMIFLRQMVSHFLLIENLQGNVSNYEDLFSKYQGGSPYKIEFEKLIAEQMDTVISNGKKSKYGKA